MLQVLNGHSLDEGGFPGAGLADDVDVRESVFVCDAEEAMIVTEVDLGEERNLGYGHTVRTSSRVG
jgi:hypothetical protein